MSKEISSDYSACSVCVEDYNKSSRQKVVCKCGFSACRLCIKTYLLDSVSDPHCMSCKEGWNREFMVDNFEKTFMTKTYKKHRETVLYERELSLLPESQPYVEKIIELGKLAEEKMEIMNQIKILAHKQIEIELKMNEISRRGIEQTQKKEFIRHCPNGDCRGFLSTQHKCGVCGIWACSECREVKGDSQNSPHQCKKEILETVKTLEKDTKSCPTCSALIFKINGCDQIWCTKCHTAFSWKTLKIENGVIHNPEYFEYLRQNGKVLPRARGDVLCGREIDNFFIRDALYIFSKKNLEIARNVIHFSRVHLTRFRVEDPVERNRNIRIEYIMKKIDMDKMKFLLQKREKENEKKKEYNDIITMFINAMTEILYRLKDTENKKKKSEICDEMQTLRQYTNECLKRVSKYYNSKEHYINENFELFASN